MSGGCGLLYNNILLDCDDLPPDVIEGSVYFINYDDILYVEFDGYPPLMKRSVGKQLDIIKLFLYGNKYAYKIESKRFAINAGYYAYELLYSDVYAHYVDIKIFSSNAEIKKDLENLTRGLYVVVVETKRAGVQIFEVYGLFSGMVNVSEERKVFNEELLSYYDISFETEVEKTEVHLPHKYIGDINWLTYPHWILWDNWWDDSGIWMDDETWND